MGSFSNVFAVENAISAIYFAGGRRTIRRKTLSMSGGGVADHKPSWAAICSLVM